MKHWAWLMSILMAGAVFAESKEVHVWASNYGKSGMDGTSKELAFGTIQEAIDAETTVADDVIIVHPGVYDQGNPVECTYDSVKTYARVKITKRLTIKGTEGHVDDTLVVGAPASGTTPTSTGGWGLGDDAVHCFYNGVTDSVIEGLTITNGFTRASGNVTGTGGGVTGPLLRTFVINCRLVGNYAYRGGAVYYVTRCDRCLFVANEASNNSSVGYNGARLSNCVIYRNSSKSGAVLFAYAGNLYNCTIVENGGSVFGTGKSNHAIHGCVFVCSTTGISANECKYEFYTNCVMNKALGSAATVDESCVIDTSITSALLVSPEKGDFRPLNTFTAVMNRADAATLAALTFPDGYVRKDYLGTGLLAEGEIHAGAVQSVAYKTTVTVVPPESGTVTVQGGTGTTGESVIYTDDKLSVIANLDRPFEGLKVDGVVQPLTVTNYEVVADSIGGAVTIELLSGTNWYVSATGGNDEWSGAYAANPCKTFKGMMAKNVTSGDCVHAAAGTYDQEVDEYTVTVEKVDQLIRARLLIPDGVTVVADEGAAQTTIKGADATDSVNKSYTATRCVGFKGSGLLRGFELTEGYTYADGAAGNSGMKSGAAAWGQSGYTPVVEDCDIHDNHTAFGTLLRLTARRCQIYDNTTADRASVGFVCAFHGCYLKGTSANRDIYYTSALKNCTLVQIYSSYGCSLVNCVLVSGNLTDIKPTEGKTMTYCLVSPKAKTSFDSETAPTSIFATTEAAMKLDATDRYRPKLGSLAIDQLDMSDEEIAALGELDLLGNPRKSGTKVDIGAFEYQYHPLTLFIR